MNFDYYPNPVKNSLTISSESMIDNIEIYSVLGQKVTSLKVDSIQTEINVSELTRGLYFVKVTSSGQEKTVKIIKE
jgi:predicted DNA-binding transcriptional regulator